MSNNRSVIKLQASVITHNSIAERSRITCDVQIEKEGDELIAKFLFMHENDGSNQLLIGHDTTLALPSIGILEEMDEEKKEGPDSIIREEISHTINEIIDKIQ